MKHNPHSKAKVRAWRINQPAPAAAAAETAPTPARGDDPLHGYTLQAIDHLTRIVIRMDRWYTAGDIDERFDAIRHAIVELLLTSTEPPARQDLLRAGTVASDNTVRDEARDHGRDISRGKPMPEFARYWASAHRGASPEASVVERIALSQILPLLRPSERRALTALAASGDFEASATALGIAKGTFSTIVSTGRRRFLAAWHEGETPSKQWRTDRRVCARNGRDHLGRNRLTAAQVEACRERHHAGETITALAAEAGLSKTGLSRLLSGKSKPAQVAS